MNGGPNFSSVTAPRKKSWFITRSAWITCGDMARFVTNRCHTPKDMAAENRDTA
jgi:hypothetical protein